MVERTLEKCLFAARWLLAPLYLGLAGLLVLFIVHFFQELWHLTLHVFELRDVDMIFGALTLIDLTLIAGLTVMVMLSGYENFVSRLDIAESQNHIAWLGKLDAGTLKLKVAASIVAISAIHLLQGFMNIEKLSTEKLVLMVVIHLTFVVSALLLAVMDRLLGGKHE